MSEAVATIEGVDDADDVERFVFDDADWVFYELILKKVGNRRVFVTFDGEYLEVMSPSSLHARHASRMGNLVWMLTVELRIPFESMGSFTLKNRKAQRGLEADRCFYTRNSAAILGKRKIDLGKDPPPDLAIEIEVSRHLLDRIDIYRRLGVPEVWCYDGQRLRVLVLGEGAGYKDVPRSPTFPGLPPDEVHRLLELSWGVNEQEWATAVKDWIRKHLSAPSNG